jgi:hypothetical protein
MSEQWEEIEVPRGSFIGWAERPGQEVIGKVVAYAVNGGTDFNDQPCPQVVIDLTARAYSVNKQGERFDYDAGDLVTVNAGLANLKAAIRKADPAPGDLLKISFSDTDKASKGTVKVFNVKIMRGGGASAAAAARQQAPAQSAPPF